MSGRAGPAPRWLRPALALGLGLLALALVLAAQRDVGIARDETVYMGHGSKYARWWLDLVGGKDGTLSEQTITAHWGGRGMTDNNREHPPLMKTLFGLSELVLHDELGVAGEVTAYRAPTAAMFALLVVVVFLWASRLRGLAVGVIAALLTLCLPRAFFHAGLACFDAPIATLWVATLWAYWRGLSSRRWAVAAGVVWGLALATKHNAFLLPFAIAPHFVWVALRHHLPATGRSAGGAARALGRGLREHWPLVASLVVLGPLVLVALWPWLWFDTVAHLRDWLRFHLDHVHYNFEYLGRNWNAPPFPWHVALVTTLLTVPAATLAAAAVGAAVWRREGRAAAAAGRRDDGAAGVLLVLSVVVAMGPFFLGSTPIFGAEKHWAAAIPSLCIAAAVGVVWAARRAAAAARAHAPGLATRAAVARGLEPAAVAVVGLAIVGAAAIETGHAQPRALTHYNAIAGGAPGGADLGMNRQFWGEAARGVLPFLRTRAPAAGAPARPVYSHDASPAWGLYVRDRLLPPTLRDSGREEAGVASSQLALVVHERHFNRHDYMIWAAYRTVRPVFVLRVDGVPVVTVYERPETGR